ncbi:Dedicator of cytokinesis protein 4 [Cichlidogyrus casuarinus]|uniref:Dedicator of cytokinesis protein 4 n=1 Tax=Cichlidogyrus casuarinus TaxID=1844966 RepID=A0ABD2PS23_9PLAT
MEKIVGKRHLNCIRLIRTEIQKASEEFLVPLQKIALHQRDQELYEDVSKRLDSIMDTFFCVLRIPYSLHELQEIFMDTVDVIEEMQQFLKTELVLRNPKTKVRYDLKKEKLPISYISMLYEENGNQENKALKPIDQSQKDNCHQNQQLEIQLLLVEWFDAQEHVMLNWTLYKNQLGEQISHEALDQMISAEMRMVGNLKFKLLTFRNICQEQISNGFMKLRLYRNIPSGSTKEMLKRLNSDINFHLKEISSGSWTEKILKIDNLNPNTLSNSEAGTLVVRLRFASRDKNIDRSDRDEFYLLLHSGDFDKTLKNGAHSVEVRITMREKDTRLPFKDCFIPDSILEGNEGTESKFVYNRRGTVIEKTPSLINKDTILYKSVILSHENSPKWKELIKFNCPYEKICENYLVFEFYQISNRDKNHQAKFFGYSSIKISEMVPKAKSFAKVCLAILRDSSEDQVNYAKYSLKRFLISDLQKRVSHKDSILLEVFLISTKLVANEKLLHLRNWRTLASGDYLKKCLCEVSNLSKAEITRPFFRKMLASTFSDMVVTNGRKSQLMMHEKELLLAVVSLISKFEKENWPLKYFLEALPDKKEFIFIVLEMCWHFLVTVIDGQYTQMQIDSVIKQLYLLWTLIMHEKNITELVKDILSTLLTILKHANLTLLPTKMLILECLRKWMPHLPELVTEAFLYDFTKQVIDSSIIPGYESFKHSRTRGSLAMAFSSFQIDSVAENREKAEVDAINEGVDFVTDYLKFNPRMSLDLIPSISNMIQQLWSDFTHRSLLRLVRNLTTFPATELSGFVPIMEKVHHEFKRRQYDETMDPSIEVRLIHTKIVTIT